MTVLSLLVVSTGGLDGEGCHGTELSPLDAYLGIQTWVGTHPTFPALHALQDVNY